MADALRFWALAELVGLISLPVAAFLFPRLPGGGLALARPLGLLLCVYPTWLLASLHLQPYGDATAVLGIGLLALLSPFLWLRTRYQSSSATVGGRNMDDRTMRRLCSPRERPARWIGLELWLVGELLFGFSFFGWVLLRSYAPDVWWTEKPMDMGIINAINRSQWFPPHDPWLSGATLNYYYFGHYIMAFLIRLTGVEPSVGFNLGVSLLYALCTSSVFAVSSALYLTAQTQADAPRCSPILPGLAATAFAMLLGNLAGGIQFLQILFKPSPLAAYDWFAPSRVIPNTANEFPFFSFLLADLHAHMMVIPFGLLTLAFTLQLAIAGPLWRSTLTSGSRDVVSPVRGARITADTALEGMRSLGFTRIYHLLTSWVPTAAELFLAALMVGSLYAVNGLDYLTGLGIGVCGFLLWVTRPGASLRWRPAILWIIAWIGMSFVVFLPFHLGFSPPTHGIAFVRDHSSIEEFLRNYLTIYGLPVWILGTIVIHHISQRTTPIIYWVHGGVIIITLFILLMPVRLGGIVLMTAALLLALHAAIDVRQPQPYRFLWLMITAAIALVTAGEVVYIRDILYDSTHNYRFNIVFKLGYQAWFFVSIAAGCAVFWSRRWMKLSVRPYWRIGLAALIALSAIYSIAGSYAREGGFANQPSLDGLRWLRTRSPGDVAAIHWIRSHVPGAPTILEAVSPQFDYDPVGHGRISTFTGLPTVLGWAGHEIQLGNQIGTRNEDVKTIYATLNIAEAQALLTRYDVVYVVVGWLERANYPAEGLAKFAHLGTPVFSGNGTTIYQIR